MEVTIQPTNRGWVKPSKGAEYSGVSLKVFRRWLKDGLKRSRLANGRILVSYQAIDLYLKSFTAENTAKRMVEELVDSL